MQRTSGSFSDVLGIKTEQKKRFFVWFSLGKWLWFLEFLEVFVWFCLVLSKADWAPTFHGFQKKQRFVVSLGQIVSSV